MIHFNSKVDVIRIVKTTNPGGLGGWVEVKNVLLNKLPCRILWKRGSEIIFFCKSTYFRDAKMFCRIADIDVKDRVKYNGKTYEVVDVANIDESSRLMTLDLKLIE